MRTYRVTLLNWKEERLTHHLLAPAYDTAEADALAWANRHHFLNGPWRVRDSEVAA